MCSWLFFFVWHLHRLRFRHLCLRPRLQQLLWVSTVCKCTQWKQRLPVHECDAQHIGSHHRCPACV